MKTIDEFATKYAQDKYLSVQTYNAVMAGANYVLECFESILPFVAKKGIIYGKIKETIEQLKSNQ